MSAHARTLAIWLADRSDEELRSLFEARNIRPDIAWQDFFDVAEGLLDPAAVERALPLLGAEEARALWQAVHEPSSTASTDQRLVSLALLRPDRTVPRAVRTAVENLPQPEAAASAASPTPAPASSQAIAAERALTTITALASILLMTRETSLALLSHGSLAAGEKKRLAENGIDDGDDLLALAEDAGLVSRAERRLRLLPRAQPWLLLSAAERWAELATGFREALPTALRTPQGGWIPETAWKAAYPWAQGWGERAEVLLHHQRLLGLLTPEGTSPAWALSLQRGDDADPRALAALLPTEVDRLFLQNDLSAIAPGPLQPALDVRLRSMAARESTAQASSYRFTADSIASAFLRGETAESIRAFLSEVSLTGVPQPLDYLIGETEKRHGLIRVQQHHDGTRISSVDTHLLNAMGVDHALRPLGLVHDGDVLVSRVNAETVSWALVDASYPAMLVDGEGRPVQAGREEIPPSPERASYRPLLDRLRAHRGPDADASWLDRELEAAVRAKATVTVEIGLPDGSLREFLLEARGIGGGRLRGLDRAADVERTLPLSSIRSARIIDAP